MTGVGKMAPQLKDACPKPDTSVPFLEPTWWKENTNSWHLLKKTVAQTVLALKGILLSQPFEWWHCRNISHHAWLWEVLSAACKANDMEICVCTSPHWWRTAFRNKTLLPFYYLDLSVITQVVRLGGKGIYLLRQLTGSRMLLSPKLSNEFYHR